MVFVLQQVCLIAVDIAGYSYSPPPSLHSSDTKYGVRKRAGGNRRIPQERKSSTTVPGLFKEVVKGKAFPFNNHSPHLSEEQGREAVFMGEKRCVDQPYNPLQRLREVFIVWVERKRFPKKKLLSFDVNTLDC